MSEAEVIQRADDLVAQGKPSEALRLTEPLAKAPAASHMALASHSSTLKQLARPEEALAYDLKAVERFAASGVAWHNYAATLQDLGRSAEAVEACEQAFRRGLDVAQTHALYARALRATGAHDRAELAYNESLARNPEDALLAEELANFVWMRRGDARLADQVLDAAFHNGGAPGALVLAKARLYEAADDAERATALIEAATVRIPDDAPLLLGGAELALRRGGRLEEAEGYLRRAEALQPGALAVTQLMAILDLASGRAAAALGRLRTALRQYPADQSLLGWAATAARIVGDPLYDELCDYEAVVGVYDIATPDGWPSLDAFLKDLAAALAEMHVYRQHPTDQSLRNGSQTMDLHWASDAPVLKAYFQAMDAPIREHMAKLGRGDDALRRRNTLDYRIAGAWSVSLRPGGFHRDHFHPQGWLSSAFYVETPDAALERPDKQGWIRFGQPPFATEPPLDAAHFVRPKPGRLVLFPSYLWHGTVPFETNEPRLTIAFDAVPK